MERIIAQAQTRGGKYVKTVMAIENQQLSNVWAVTDTVNGQLQSRCCNIPSEILALNRYNKQIRDEKLYDNRTYYINGKKVCIDMAMQPKL